MVTSHNIFDRKKIPKIGAQIVLFFSLYLSLSFFWSKTSKKTILKSCYKFAIQVSEPLCNNLNLLGFRINISIIDNRKYNMIKLVFTQSVISRLSNIYT